MREISLGAMGADMADINNDAWPEIFATEMTPEGNARLKTKALFENWETYQKKVAWLLSSICQECASAE